MREEIQFNEDPEDVPTDSPAPKVVHRHRPAPGDDMSTPSDAIQCPRCKRITWAWAHQERAHCVGCRLTFYNHNGTWLNRFDHLSAKKTPNPKG